eukprot:CAMPEP_0177737042 /NCGR_PEP_ID=MMETSP0484_2-20121128/25670_1 /TAXON_ID=354590 /ORGANISM="Rhodomonas lens, Strain RHODO" /LENGTH=113 /DNA_ID=CAMNT_0019250789 /DNA_START=54 /DNA_END=392 /DNA_ORIENTATION=+
MPPKDKLSRWLNRVEEGTQQSNGAPSPNGSSMVVKAAPPVAAANGGGKSKLDRWLARTEPGGSAVGQAGGGEGGGVTGLSACCNLIRLLHAEELVTVHSVIIAAMGEKGVPTP